MLIITNKWRAVKWLAVMGCVFTLASSIASCVALADEPTVKPGPSIIDRLAADSTPLDERERILYQQERGDFSRRQGLVLKWMRRSGAAKPFATLQAALRQDHPELWDTMINANRVDLSELDIFFAESLLFFKMVRNNQSKGLIDDQFLNWRNTWLKIDMRLMPKEQAAQWSSALLEIYTLAFIEAGPWTFGSEARIDTYFSQRPEFLTKSRVSFARTLLGLSRSDPVSEKREIAAILTGMILPLIPSTYGMNLLLSPLQTQLLSLPSSAGLYIILGGVVAWLSPSMVAMSLLPKWPRSYEILGKRFSVMFPPSGPRCQDLLKAGNRRAK